MRILLYLCIAVALCMPLSARAQLAFPTGNIVVVTESSPTDATFAYTLKDGSYPYDEWDSFTTLTSGGGTTYHLNALPAFPNRFQILQGIVSDFDLTVNCISNLSGFSFFTLQGGVGVTLHDGETITCTFHNAQKTAHSPALIIPGIMGTELYKGSEKLWADVPRMFLSNGDEFMNSLGFDSLGAPVDSSVSVGNIIDQAATLNYSEKLVSDLHAKGYTDNQDLFFFPYDWRKELSTTADIDLKNKIDSALSASGQSKIDIIAHSQGGLVIKKLLLDHPEYKQKISKLIFVGTPHLGAPKAAKALLYGDSMGASFLGLGLDPLEIKRIGLHMPAVYELLPSSEYFQHYAGYLGIASRSSVLSPWQTSLFNEANTKASLAAAGLDSGLVHSAGDFHTSNLDSFDFSGSGIAAYNIVGCEAGTITEVYQRSGGKFRLGYGAGDGTVPVKSASNLFGAKTYFQRGSVDHGAMLTEDGTRQQILELLSGSESLANSSFSLNSQDCHFKGQVVEVHSPVDMHLYDAQGRHTGKQSDGTVELGILGSQYDEVGEEKFIFVPDLANYRVELFGNGTGNAQIKHTLVSDAGDGASETWANVPVSSFLSATFTAGESLGASLFVDENGDGSVDKTLVPVVLSAEQSNDLVPPQSTINLSGAMGQSGFFRSDVAFGLSSVDSAQVGATPSGVENIYYRFTKCPAANIQISMCTNGQWQTFVSPVNVTVEGEYAVEFFAVDKAGNSDPVQSAFFNIDKAPPEANVSFDAAKMNLKVVSDEGLLADFLNGIYSLSDKAGNITTLEFKEKDFSKSLAATLKSLKYNGVASSLVNNYFAFSWTKNAGGSLKTLSQNAFTIPNFFVTATYKSGQTYVAGLDSQQGVVLKTLSGLHLLNIFTKKGQIGWNVQ